MVRGGYSAEFVGAVVSRIDDLSEKNEWFTGNLTANPETFSESALVRWVATVGGAMDMAGDGVEQSGAGVKAAREEPSFLKSFRNAVAEVATTWRSRPAAWSLGSW